MDITIMEIRQKKRELEEKIFASLPKKEIEEYGELIGHVIENISICYYDVSTYNDVCPHLMPISISISPDYIKI